MNLPFYIAKRYLVSRKSHHIINIISAISVIGVTIGTMALIIVLSVFNGFENLVASLYSSFNPDLQITVKTGKTFNSTSIPEDQIKKIPGVRYLAEVIEENALMRYKDKQYIVTMKGVSEDFMRMSGVDTMITAGKFQLHEGNKNSCILGYGVAMNLDANLSDFLNPLTIYVPRRTVQYNALGDNAFNSDVIFPSGIFAIQDDFDSKYVILPISFVRDLLEYKQELTAMEINISKEANPDIVQSGIQHLIGNQFYVKNRYQQQEFLFKIMKSEKWVIFLILSFILLIATFNVIGSLSMLILDKRKDIAVLQSLGASQSVIKKIFLTEGILISTIGAISGLILGALICWLQQRYGLVQLGSADSTFVVKSYPVHMQIRDFLFVLITVTGIGLLATWYPVYNIRKINISAIYQRS
ncbi:MAG: FtsX-like permease family protein [Bacteroidetes bacterium]|nr:FtsX-like permease family protein [Bacteroidota bacterium]